MGNDTVAIAPAKMAEKANEDNVFMILKELLIVRMNPCLMMKIKPGQRAKVVHAPRYTSRVTKPPAQITHNLARVIKPLAAAVGGGDF